MTGAVAMLESGEADEAEARWQIKSLRAGVEMMTSITSDFLDIHALHAGKLKLHEAWTNIGELLEG